MVIEMGENRAIPKPLPVMVLLRIMTVTLLTVTPTLSAMMLFLSINALPPSTLMPAPLESPTVPLTLGDEPVTKLPFTVLSEMDPLPAVTVIP